MWVKKDQGIEQEGEKELSTGDQVVTSLKSKFESNTFLDLNNKDLSFNAAFPEAEISSVNFDAFVFSTTNYSTQEIASMLNASKVVYDSPGEVRFEIPGETEALVQKFQKLVNEPLIKATSGRTSLSYVLVYRGFLLLDETDEEYHGGNITRSQATHEDLLYRLYLNNYLVAKPDKLVTIDIKNPIKDESAPMTVTFTRFFPSEFEIVSKVSFLSGSTRVKPAFSLDRKFVSTLTDSGAILSQKDFEIGPGSTTLLYVFDGERYLAPILAKNATLTKFPELSNKTFVLTAY